MGVRGWLAAIAVVVLVAWVGTQATRRSAGEGPVRPTRPMPAPQRDPEHAVRTPDSPVPPPPAPGPDAPEFAPGQSVTIVLTEPAALRYLAPPADGNDAFYAQLVSEESHGRAVFDPALGHAAREFVYQYENLGQDPPSDVRTFLITAAGGLAGDTVFQHARSSSDAETTLRRAIQAVLQSPPSGSGRLHVGVGEVYQPGASLSRHVGVVATPLWVDVEPMARTAQPGETWTLRGTLRGPWTQLEAIVLRPDGTLETLPVQVTGNRVAVPVPVGQQRGTVEVQVVGEGPDGPGKLVQAAVEVGQPPPTTYRTILAPDESKIQTVDEASAYAWQLLNADRVKHGRAALSWDPALAAIAREHSADMRDHGFFGHVSPTTGLHTQRLQTAGYLARGSAENVAHNPRIFEAELGLMHSLGHRRNILSADMTHGGIGIAGAEDDNGKRRWWVTQLFARPVVREDAAVVAARLRGALASERARLGMAALRPEDALDSMAATSTDAALAGDLKEASGRALRAVQDAHARRGRVHVWAALAPDVDALVWPDAVRAETAERLGIAAKQGQDGRWAVVILVVDAE